MTFSSDKSLVLIETLEDLRRYLDASEWTVSSLNHRIYKDTSCGASISIYGSAWGQSMALHCGYRGDYPKGFAPTYFTIQTIVEGSDATVQSEYFYFGDVTAADLDAWIEEMEERADALWREANGGGGEEESS